MSKIRQSKSGYINSVVTKTLNHKLTLILSVLFVLACAIRGESGTETTSLKSLSETGLYSNFAAKSVAKENLMYSPQYPLWSDGAAKQRWVYLPLDSTIDASDAENWVFPVGTKFWKEFTFDKRVETRIIEKTGPKKWAYQTYAWNDEQTDAFLVGANGSRNHFEIAEGIKHDIPGVNDCKVCHEGDNREVILGFNALQLSPDRDSLAPHAEKFDSSMIDLNDLIAQGRLVNLADEFKTKPPRIQGKTPRERAALGYIWANCGGCHNADDPLASVGMELKLPLFADSSAQDSALASVVGHPSKFKIPDNGEDPTYRILPGYPEHSSVIYRMLSRNPVRQMPPLGTKIVDQEAVDLISEWIRDDLGR